RCAQPGRAALRQLPGRGRGLRRAAAGRDRRRGGAGQEGPGVMEGVYEYQVLAALLFLIGAAGVLIRRSLIAVFMWVELMLNAANLSLVAFSRLWGNLSGQLLVFVVIVVAAVEVAVGLAILISLMRNRDSVDVDDASLLKW